MDEAASSAAGRAKVALAVSGVGKVVSGGGIGVRPAFWRRFMDSSLSEAKNQCKEKYSEVRPGLENGLANWLGLLVNN
jgi:hypothetical protein